jgi:YD repeat-containing protein
VDRTYNYDPATGQLAGIHSSNGQDETFSYDGSGNLTSAGLPDGVHKFGRSASGDLASFSTAGTSLVFSSDADGLIAGMSEGKNASTTMKHTAGGELGAVIFSDGQNAKYEFQPSGLRANITYKDKRRAEYSYDPAGNLTSTKIFDAKGKQTAGQLLTLDDSYQLIQHATFAGNVTKFAYDKNGNLTEIRQDKSLTRFEYDSLNRLTAVITPDGQRLTHEYKPGERSLVEEYEHAKASILDRRDTGLTFGSPADILASRPLTGLLGALRFSASLGTFQLPNMAGDEIITPEQAIEQPLEKLNIVADGTPLQQRQDIFNRPFNPMFIPAEYATINCCPECITRPPHCFDCVPDPPPTFVSLDCTNSDLSFGSSAPNATLTGTCTATGTPSGGSFSWQSSTTAISLTPNAATASYSSANPSSTSGDTAITVTYTANSQSASATFGAITVHKPTSLQAGAVQAAGTAPCTLPCLTNPGNGSCAATVGTSCTYSAAQSQRIYTVLDQFGTSFASVGINDAAVTEQVNLSSNNCGGSGINAASAQSTIFSDTFGKCDTCCQQGGPGCTSVASQTLSVNGIVVRTPTITVTCTTASVTP